MYNEALVVIVRVIISFFTLLIFTRLLGKQEVGQLTFFDYINGITIGSIAATLATDLSSKAWAHWVGLSGYAFLTFLLQFITIKNRYLGKVLDGEPTVVIENGKILENNLKKMRIKLGELMMLLRYRGIFDITQVECAIIEVNGNLSVLQKAEYLPVTSKDLHIPSTPSRLSTEVIQDGIVIEQNLSQRNKDMEWLNQQLQTHGIGDVKEVSFALILPNEQLYVDKYKDNLGDEADMGDYEGPY
ncbi:YetF domain-containing protein [Thalassobacillus hwangdonensis]|uniref:YetF domain-containing protein n=1 Tax=Thalassobacillus hwangdonensis TaxID=546108 RepID=A0ABW3L4J7_9BACI